MSCKYGRYPFCKQCVNTGETCEDKYKKDEKEYIDENKKELIKQVNEMLEG